MKWEEKTIYECPYCGELSEDQHPICGECGEPVKSCKSERQQLIDALMFYANYENWKSPSKGFALQYDPEPSKVNKYRGSVAQTALEKAGVKFE